MAAPEEGRIPAKHEFRISHACDEVEENVNPIVEYHNVQTAARTHKLTAAVSLIRTRESSASAPIW